MQPLYGDSAVACLLQTRSYSFEAAFFKDSATAGSFRVCETQSGSRYLFRLSGYPTPIDAPDPLYWTVRESVVLMTLYQSLDTTFKLSLGGATPPC
jgi:hypothetical protein